MREYARIRGVNLNAVQTAIKSGRIHKTRDDKIDVDEANREWFMNTDPAQQRKPDPLFEAQGGVRMSNMGTFQQAKTADIYYRAMLAIRNNNNNKQIIFVTHNPLLVVNLDVDNVIFLKNMNGNIEASSGCLEFEDSTINILDTIAENMDGGKDTIERRLKVYGKNY